MQGAQGSKPEDSMSNVQIIFYICELAEGYDKIKIERVFRKKSERLVREACQLHKSVDVCVNGPGLIG